MRMASGRIIKMAQSGFMPDRIIVKIISQVAMELREAKKPLVVESKPITARVIEPRPIKGERKVLSRAVFHEKRGRKAFWILVRKLLKVRPGARSSSGMMLGLTKIATTRAAKPNKIINKVRISGAVGKVLIVNLKCGCSRAKRTIKVAR